MSVRERGAKVRWLEGVFCGIAEGVVFLRGWGRVGWEGGLW